MNQQARLEKLMKAPACAYGERVLMEMRYAREVSKVDGGKWDGVIDAALAALEAGILRNAAVTEGVARAAEEALLPMAAAAKRYTVLCAGHAHIDMNWMWRYDETVSVTLDTFRTVLQLMEEYPSFTFSQSQAAVYEMVEKYDPAMLEEIRRRVAEGRWELTAATWVEADRNMPSGESVARHLLYTRRYLEKLFPGVTDKSFQLDFEPDTFGHGACTPELLAQGGVKYYYHCRGDEEEPLRRWRAPSGAEVLAYREPFWYLGGVDAEYALAAPCLCERYGMDTHLRVYGVGDHGGGPTRRDIERILDMDGWPVFPHFRFGTCREFFEKAEKARNVPVVNGERNSIFTGCYTSQSRITQANRYGEAHLDEAERYGAAAKARTGLPCPSGLLEEAWRGLLFSQFHDLLPGTCIIDSREFAMASFSRALAAADTQSSRAMRALGACVDTSAWQSDAGMQGSTSEGSGLGYGVGHSMSGVDPTPGVGAGRPFRVAQTERGRGINRIFHVFNPSPVPRDEVVEFSVFDWPGDYRRLKVLCGGRTLAFQILDEEPQHFWEHSFVRVLVSLSLPAGGRATCVLTQDDEKELAGFAFRDDLRRDKPFVYTLENGVLRAQFSPETGALISLYDKEKDMELLNRPSGFFRLIQEQPAEEAAGTAWSVGRYQAVTELTDHVMIDWAVRGPLRSALTFTAFVNDSRVRYTVSLCEGSRWLDIFCDVDWRELGIPEKATPQLNFTLPLACRPETFVQDIPGGVLCREGRPMDVACQSFAAARYSSGGAVMLMADSHYGFRCENTPQGCAMSLSCLRSSSDPDPYPEFGRHQFRIGIGLCGTDKVGLMNTAYAFCHAPSVVSDIPRAGTAPLCEQGFALSGAFMQSMKPAQESDGIVIRLLAPGDQNTEASLSLWADIRHAEAVDTHERALATQPPLRIQGNMLSMTPAPFSTTALKITF